MILDSQMSLAFQPVVLGLLSSAAGFGAGMRGVWSKRSGRGRAN